MTKFILVKNNCTCRTSCIEVVTALRELGWEVKQSPLGALL